MLMVQASAAGNKPFHNMGEGDADKRPNTRASGDDEVTHATCIGHRQGEAHWIDAACVGESGECVYIAPGHAPLLIKANGRQSRLMCVESRTYPRM